jgi:CHAD domain-containing protein
MSFEFKSDEPANKGIRRIVREQLRKARKELEELAAAIRSGGKNDEPVHSIRKRFKRLRAVCRLVRAETGEKWYKSQNTRFRDAGRPLTEVRDAKILIDTLDKLLENSAAQANPDELQPVRHGLEANYDRIRRAVLENSDALSAIHKTVKHARVDIKNWPIGGGGWSIVGLSLERGYERCQKAGAAAAKDSDIENLHEWRKQAKYFWHELQLIAPSNPDALNSMANAVHELTKRLGDDHDLAVLTQTVVANCDDFGGESVVGKLLPLVEPPRAELQQQAFELQRRLFSEDVEIFLQRLRASWKSWRTAASFVRL